MKPQMKWLKNEKGLTLIELLAVIVVLGIIAAIAVPAIQGTIEKQRDNADEKSAEIIEAAALRYFYDYYPEGPSGGDGAYHVNVSNLKDDGYLSGDFAAKLQSDNLYFVYVVANYSSTNGWAVTNVVTDADSTTTGTTFPS